VKTVWNEPRSLIVGEHSCYFCQPLLYPPMPSGHTLCACCGELTESDGHDPMNQAMRVCGGCERRMEEEARYGVDVVSR